MAQFGLFALPINAISNGKADLVAPLPLSPPPPSPSGKGIRGRGGEMELNI